MPPSDPSISPSTAPARRRPAWSLRLTRTHLAWGLAGALALVVFGYLALARGVPAVGLGSWALAMLVFAVVVRRLEAPAAQPVPAAPETPVPAAPARPEASALQLKIPAVVLAAFSLWAVLFATNRVDVPGGLSAAGDRLTLLVWIGGMLAFTVAVLYSLTWQPPQWRVVRAGLTAHRVEIVQVVLLAALALGLRLYQLDDHPFPLLKDEGFVGLESLRLLQGSITNLFQGGWSQQPVWASLPTALSITVFGNTVFALRVVSAVLGTLNIVVLYLLARLWFDRLTALLAAGFLLAIPVYLHFSRLGVTNLVVPFFATLSFWLIYRALHTGRLSAYLWAGLALGASFYSYLGNRLVVALVGLTLVYYCVYQRSYLRRHMQHLAVFGLAVAVVALPVTYFFYRHPDMAMSAYNSSGIIPTGWLTHEVAVNGRSLFDVLATQFLRSTLVFVNEPAWAGFFNSPRPFLNPLAAVLGIIGLGMTIWRWREPRSITLLSWFWSIVIVGSALTLTPPTSERLVGSVPAAALFVALGAVEVIGWAKRRWTLTPRMIAVGCLVAVGLSTAIDAAYYFGEYRTQRFFGMFAEELELTLSQSLVPTGGEVRLYLLTAPTSRADFFPTHDYLVPAVEAHDLPDVTTATLAALPRDKQLMIVASPDREAELQAVAQVLPGGAWSVVPRLLRPNQPPEVLYYAYALPAAP